MPIKNAIHSQQVYDPTDDSIMESRNFAWNGYWNSSRMDTATIMCRMALYEIRVYTRRSLYVRTFFQIASCNSF